MFFSKTNTSFLKIHQGIHHKLTETYIPSLKFKNLDTCEIEIEIIDKWFKNLDT